MAETRGEAQDGTQEDVSVEMERTRGGASLILNDSLHRLLAHAVCLYHSVQVSAAFNSPSAARCLVCL
jgi:hypothetical protein